MKKRNLESIGEDIFSVMTEHYSIDVSARVFPLLISLCTFPSPSSSSLEAQDSPQFVVMRELRGESERNNQEKEDQSLEGE